jgi:peptide/nickel transport system permease protein
MSSYIARRLLTSVVTVAGIVVVVFVVVRILPGDGAVLRAGPYASEERIQQVREQFGLDEPLTTQFATYVGNVLQGDLGTSIRTGQPVTEELLDRLSASIELALFSVIVATLVGIPLGILAAARQGRVADWFVRVLAVIGSSMALFWLGLVVIYVFFYRLGWLPGPIGRLGGGIQPPPNITGLYTVDALLTGQWATFRNAISHLVLPVATLAFVLSAPIMKIVRAAMIDTLDSDHVRTARALGVPPRQVLFRDGFRNALIPVVTTLGIVFGYMLGGNIIVEFLFSWPGIGRYAFTATQGNDIDALQGFVILVGVLYVMLNVLIDLLYVRIDPRIRLAGRGTQ